ncbi:MAG: CDP-glycerol glycerophosphotransferase family protein [Faecousia sp.]
MPHNRINIFLRKVRRLLLQTIKQDVILFESIPPYSDNTWAVYQYIRDNGMLKNYKLQWILRPNDQPRSDIPSFVRIDTRLGKLRYKNKLLHSKALVFCNSEQCKLRHDQVTIYLGHGSCLKSVRGVYSMSQNLDYALIQAPAFADPTRYEHTMSDNTILAPLGYPRNDDFFGDVPLDRATLFSVPFRKLIVWYPTFRQHKNGRVTASSITLPLLHDADAAARINACAKENGVLVVLKPHFAQDTSYIRKADLSNLVFIDDSFFTKHNIRPYQFLHMSDGLITDFSSVYYDYLLQDKPIALVWEDFEEYRQNNGFAVDTDVYCAGGEKVYTAEDLCGFIRRVANGEDVLREERTAARDLTNAYADGNNAQRVAQWVQAAVDAYPRKIHQVK